MTKIALTLLLSLAATAGALAQDRSGVTVSTDPARAAAVEKHAQDIKSRQAQPPQAKSAAKTSQAKKSGAKKSSTKTQHASKGTTKPKAETKAASKPKAEPMHQVKQSTGTAKPAAKQAAAPARQ